MVVEDAQGVCDALRFNGRDRLSCEAGEVTRRMFPRLPLVRASRGKVRRLYFCQLILKPTNKVVGIHSARPSNQHH